MAVQRLGLHPSIADGRVQSLGGELRTHEPCAVAKNLKKKKKLLLINKIGFYTQRIK